MNISDTIIQLAKENNGVITSAAITEKGISRGNLKKLVDEGKLERSVRGVYILPEVWGDEFVDLQARFKKGIFSCYINNNLFPTLNQIFAIWTLFLFPEKNFSSLTLKQPDFPRETLLCI